MEKPSRNRLQSITARMGSQRQVLLPHESLSNKQLGKLEVTIPRSLSQQLSPKVDYLLRPLQTQSQNRNNIARGRRPLPPLNNLDPIDKVVDDLAKERKQKRDQPKKQHRPPNPEYKLVDDKDVPDILKDYKHKKRYKKLESLGHGAFARVYRVVREDGQQFAAKIVAKESLKPEKIKQKLLAEINIHRVLQHDYIVKFHSCFEDKLNIYLLLEICENKTLNIMIRSRKTLTEDEVRYYMGQILSALRYMSDNRILHRDLKLSNILLDSNMDCKLGDFGLAALLVDNKDRKRTVCGTPHYIAPEILFDKKGGHNHRVDMWSAGVLMYNLLYGKHPFHHENPDKLYAQVKENEHNDIESIFPPDNYTVSAHAKDLISKLLVNNPDNRLSVIEALEHPFFFEHAIPERIPKRALYSIPSQDELFGKQFPEDPAVRRPPSKVATAIQLAKDRNQDYIDYNINPPLQIMSEHILDPRSQYPIKESSQPANSLIIPVATASESTSKKRLNIAEDKVAKRVCSDTDIKTKAEELKKIEKENIPEDIELPKVEDLQVHSDPGVDNRPFAVPLPLRNRKPVMEETADNLKVMINRTSVTKKEKCSEKVKEDEDFEWRYENVFVQNWMDCTAQYGFSYRLSDGTWGMLYNDGTTITTVDNNQFYYLKHIVEDNSYVETTYGKNIPFELKKKCDVLNQFKTYMNKSLPFDEAIPQATGITKIVIFKYIVSEAGIAFRLNNGVIQFNFFKYDHGKLILYDKGNKLIYIDRARKFHHYNTIDIFNSNETVIIEALHRAFGILDAQNKERQDALRQKRWDRIEKHYNIEPSTPPFPQSPPK